MFGLTDAHKDQDILGKTHGVSEVLLVSFLLQRWDFAFIFWLISGAGQHRVAARGKTEMGRAGEKWGCAVLKFLSQLLPATARTPPGTRTAPRGGPRQPLPWRSRKPQRRAAAGETGSRAEV